MENEKLIREALKEKRPPLYVYNASIGEKKVFLNEIIPYITTEKETIEGFLSTIDQFLNVQFTEVAKIIEIRKKGIRILVVEEKIIGKSLREVLRKEGGIGFENSLNLIPSITSAVKDFHSKGIFGLGIEPKNLIFVAQDRIKVIHPVFPIAERYFKKTEKPEILNPRYLSPEHIEKNITDEKGDLFNIGVILYEMLTGNYPFNINSYEIRKFDKSVPYCLQFIVKRLLDKDPSQRFASLSDFIEELDICKKDIKDQGIKEEKKIILKEKKKQRITKVKESVPPKAEKKKPKKRSKPISKIFKKVGEVLTGLKRFLTVKNVAISIGSILFIVLIFLLLPKLIRKIHPYNVVSLRIERNTIEAIGTEGKLLWKYEAGSDISFSEAVDFDNDGRKEVVFGTGYLVTDEKKNVSKGTDNGKVYLFDENGNKLFARNTGKDFSYPEGPQDWIVYDVRMVNIDEDNKKDIIALSINVDSTGCSVFIHTQKGLTSRFLNAGAIKEVKLFARADGGKELVMGGTNKLLGNKPVVFALKVITPFVNQSPPWFGKVKEKGDGLLWYRFLPGGGEVKEIKERDSVTIDVETSIGLKEIYQRNGFVVLKEDTTEDMVKNRGEKYFKVFKVFKTAEEYKNKNKLKKAIEFYNKVLQLQISDNAFNSVIYYEKAMAMFQDNRWNSSIPYLVKAVKTDPKFFGGFEKLGIAYSEIEKFGDAISAFKNAYNLSRKENYFYRMVDTYTAIGNYRMAKRLLAAHKKRVKDRSKFLLISAKVAREEGSFDKSALSLSKLLSIEPGNNQVKILLADVYADLNKNIKKADSLFTEVCENDSSMLNENIETKAWILYRQSHFEEAYKAINAAVNREQKRKKKSVTSRRKLPRLYYRVAIIAQTLGKKKIEKKTVKPALASKFCKGYIRRQLRYFLASLE